MSEVPKGWVEAKIGDIAEYVSRGRSPKYVGISELPVINQRCVRWHGVDEQFVKFVDPTTWHQWDGDRYVRRNDILWNSTGTGTIGRAALFTELHSYDRAVVDSHVTIVRAGPAVEPAYLFGFIRSPAVQDKIGDMQSGSTNQVELNRSEILSTVVPIAPLQEQRRIVAKVRGFTARTARAREELDRVPTLIARYKQRLLALAFSGELTAGWRAQNPATGTALEQIRSSRKNDARLARRKRPALLPNYEIPESWDWISPDEVAADAQYSIGIGPFGSNLVRADYRESGVRLVFVRDIRRGTFSDSDARYVDEKKAAELHQHIAGPGDVLITKMGDPPGDSALFPTDAQPAVITADCIKLTPHQKLASSKYLNYGIRSEIVQSQFLAITAGVAQQKVSLDRFRQLALPIAPLTEQAEIVRRIEAAFSWLDRVTADHAAAARLLPRLDAAILSKAYRGDLVPQDPRDEPASVLLERIEREREAGISKSRGKMPGVLLSSTVRARDRGPRPRQISKGSKVTKSRNDPAVKGKPYLTRLLRTMEGRARAEALYARADLSLVDFYKQLSDEHDRGWLLEDGAWVKAA